MTSLQIALVLRQRYTCTRGENLHPHMQPTVRCACVAMLTHQPAYKRETPKGRRPPYCVYPCNADQIRQLVQLTLNYGKHSARTALYLLVVTQSPDKLLNRYGLLVCKGVSLGSQPTCVYEDIGVSCRCIKTQSDSQMLLPCYACMKKSYL